MDGLAKSHVSESPEGLFSFCFQNIDPWAADLLRKGTESRDDPGWDLHPDQPFISNADN